MSLVFHLAESSAFACLVWLLNLVLRGNPARLRHCLWMAASVKFLMPFALFVALASQATRHIAVHGPPPQMRFVMVESAPPVAAEGAIPARPVRRDWRENLVWLVWGCGCAGMLVRWRLRWMRATRGTLLGPAVVGIFRPVLMLPEGIEERLTPEQLQAVVAHEICHVRHRDNLAAAVHMIVEAIFWFHPLVWWIGVRLVEERERACDEEVLERGSDRATYAASILRVCELCLESPVACVSGVTGADLKRRIREIMHGSVPQHLETRQKALLAAFGLAALAVPLGIGWTHPAQTAALTAAPLQFDAASVKISDQRYLNIFPKRSGGRIEWIADLGSFLRYAYHIESWQISGAVPGPDHIYSIQAVTDPKATEDQVRLMFQSLLVSRFQMAVHRETRQIEGFALTVGKGGIKIPEATPEDQPPALPGVFRGEDPRTLDGKVLATIQSTSVGAITGRRVTMLQLAGALERVLRTAVFDETGLNAKYYFDFEFAREDPPEDTDRPDLFHAIEELGLKLEKHRGAAEILVVDHIEKVPTENLP